MTRQMLIERLESRALLDADGLAGGGLVGGNMVGGYWASEGESDVRPEFHLVDVNPASPRFGQSVSPRDYLDQISAWYFGHST